MSLDTLLSDDELNDVSGGMLETHYFKTPTGCLAVGESILLFSGGRTVSIPNVHFTPGACP